MDVDSFLFVFISFFLLASVFRILFLHSFVVIRGVRAVHTNFLLILLTYGDHQCYMMLMIRLDFTWMARFGEVQARFVMAMA